MFCASAISSTLCILRVTTPKHLKAHQTHTHVNYLNFREPKKIAIYPYPIRACLQILGETDILHF